MDRQRTAGTVLVGGLLAALVGWGASRGPTAPVEAPVPAAVAPTAADAPFAPAPHASGAPGRASLHVEAVDDAGHAVAGARVQVVAARDDGLRTLLAHGTTDGSGTVGLPDGDGPVTVVVRRAGHVSARIALDAGPGSGPVRTVRARLDRLATLRVRVADASGTPVPDAYVALDPGADPTARERPARLEGAEPAHARVRDARTDAEGTLELRELLPGLPLTVVATTTDGGSSARVVLTLEPGERRELALGLLRRLTVRARLTDRRGRAVVGAKVTDFLVHGTDLAGHAWTTSRDDGTIVLAGLPAGRHRLVASAWDADGATLSLYGFAVEGREDQDLDLGEVPPVGETVRLRVDVEGDDGGERRVALAMWNAATPDGVASPTFDVVAPTGRELVVDGMSPGTWSYAVSVLRAGSDVLPDQGFVPATDAQPGAPALRAPSAAGIRIAVRRRPTPTEADRRRVVTVRVTPGAAATAPGLVEVAAFEPTGALHGWVDAVRADGTSSVPLLVPGDGEVLVLAKSATAVGRATVRFGPAEARRAVTIALDAPAPRVVGRLVWRADGSPVGAATFALRTVPRATAGGTIPGETLASGRTGLQGELDVAVFPSVPWRLVVRTDRGEDGILALEGLPDGGRTPPRFELDRPR